MVLGSVLGQGADMALELPWLFELSTTSLQQGNLATWTHKIHNPERAQHTGMQRRHRSRQNS
jgi:hypothetical protein